MKLNRARDLFLGGEFHSRKSKEGKIGWALLWLMGVPLPFLLLFFLLRGCT